MGVHRMGTPRMALTRDHTARRTKTARARALDGAHWLAAVALVAVCCGCGVIRVADFMAPAIRFDRAANRPLPGAGDPAVEDALARWRALPPAARTRYPTPYHSYVQTPAPGSFEGEYAVGLAFSGGGTRGTVFCAMCVDEIEQLGAILVRLPEGTRRIDPLADIDFVSGVSTGAIPAAAFVLDRGPNCPGHLRRDAWPECFNRDLVARSFKGLALHPHIFLRDLLIGMNGRPAMAGAMASAFFEGAACKPASGLTFRALPEVPLLFIGSTVINDPGTPFVQTRLPYRYALDTYPDTEWGVGVQSFESFHSDPMAYALGEACYNSSAFPGYLRSGLMRLHPDQPWVGSGLPEPEQARMARARNQPGYAYVYDLKDGGLVDNRGVSSIDRVFESLARSGGVPHTPLLIGLDAGYRELRAPERGGRLLKKGWFNEVYSASRASWQTGQDAYERLFDAHSNDGLYAYARFRFVAWTPYLGQHGPESDYLAELCRGEPAIGDAGRLLEVLRGIGTTMGDLTDAEMDAIRVAARFAVWHERDTLLEWASAIHGGAPAAFENAPPP
ncbi:MAG: patatin-like phospholipase family protein [Candidatus Hydrogenedentes bacterium]|nr:patatin-like phospholipase family protein [Candidatus Hydrogenedentota bacterium]